MKEKNIRELAKRMGLITVEDMCQYTITQLVVKIANKVNELVGEVWRFETDVQEMLKTQNENIQYLLGEGLHLEVENIFDGWVQDGTFDTLLNQSALKKVNDRIDETNAQLSEKISYNEGGAISVAMLSQEVREAMTGGSVAVVGENSVLTKNIVDKQVTPEKTTFISPTKNLFNKSTVKKGYYWNVSTGEQPNESFSYNKIYIEQGKTYIVSGTSYNTSFFNSSDVKLASDNNSNGGDKLVINTSNYTGVAYMIVSFRHDKYPIGEYMCVESSILPSEYIAYGYKFDRDVILKNNDLHVKKDGTGDFTTVYNAVKYAERNASKENVYNIYIHDTSTNYKGTSFDILDEMGGNAYLATITNTNNNQLGLPLKGYINLIGVGKVKLYAHLPDSCTLAQSTCFSTLDIFGETILENLTIEIKNGRYAVHDESNNKYPNKKHRFKKCKFIHLGNKSGLWSAPHAYASGTSSGCIYEYEDCIFDASASGGYPWDLHNYAPQQGSTISFNGCEMIKSASQAVSMKFGFNGYSPITTDPVAYEVCFNDVYIKNIIADGTVQVAPEVNSYSCTNNFRLHNFTNLKEDVKDDFIK